MRFPLAVGLATLGASLVACNALLGDFTVDPNAVVPRADSGGDGDIAEGGEADGATDAPADVTPAPPVLPCVINGTPVTVSANAGATSDLMAIHAFNSAQGQQYRIVWAGGPIAGGPGTGPNFMTTDEKLRSLDFQSYPSGPALQALASYDGGFIALGVSQDGGGPHLTAIRFDDADMGPSPVIPITASDLFTPMAQDFRIALAPIGGDQFFLVFTYTEGGNKWTMLAGQAYIPKGAMVPVTPKPMTKVTSEIMTRPGFDSDGLVIDKPDGAALLFMAPDRGAGPTMLQRLELATGRPVGPAAVVAPLHPGSSFVPLSAQTDVLPAADKVGLAFLEYNLNSTTDPLYVYAAAVPALGLAAFKPTQLPTPVSFANVSDVAVDKGRSFWTHFPTAGSHVVSAARGTKTGKGVNFLWLDGDGHLRGKASGSTALVPGEMVEAAAGTLTGPPSLLIGSAVVAWLATSGNGTMELRAANVGCSK